MPIYNGTPLSRGRGALSVSPAARYRELRVNRAIYLLGSLVLLAPWFMWFSQLQVVLRAAAALGGASAHTYVRVALQAFVQGPGVFNSFGVFVAAALGIALFGYDRIAGGLFYSLEGPLRRREVFLAKAMFGTASILLAVTVGTAGTLVAAALSGNLSLSSAILLRGAFDATGQLSLFATALAMGGAMGPVFSCLATATWAGLPELLGSLVGNLFLVVGRQVATLGLGGHRVMVTTLRFAAPWLARLELALPNLSPFQPSGFIGWPLVGVLALIAWFVAWTVLLLWLALGWWERAPFEHLHDGVFFPFLWNVYYAFLSLVSGLVVTTLLTRGLVFGLAWAAIYAATFVAGWFFWRFVVRKRGRRVGSYRTQTDTGQALRTLV